MRAETPIVETGRRAFGRRQVSVPFSERRALLLLGDGAAAVLACAVALRVWALIDAEPFGWGLLVEQRSWFLFSVAAWWLVAWVLDLYDVPLANRRAESAQRILRGALLLLATYLIVYFLSPRGELPRWFILVFLPVMTAGLLAWRMAYATVFTLTPMRQRMLIVGAGWAGRTLAALLGAMPDSPYEVVGFVDDDASKVGAEFHGVRVLGSGHDLLPLVGRYHVSQVVVAVTHDLRGELFQGLVDCEARGVPVRMMSDLYEGLTRRVPVEHISKQWLLLAMNGFAGPQSAHRFAKRALDLLLGAVGLLAFGLALPVVALAVKLDDGGPVFYRQTRAGLAGVPFQVIKFRTMRVDAEQDGARWAAHNDSRVTRPGRLLRRTRIDELPQVLNVLRGEMSIVGPRPERPEFIRDLEAQIPFYRARLVVKPGLTGWAQIHYGYGNSVEDALVKLQYDLYYIRHQSLWTDLYTIVRTIGVMLRMKGM